MGLQRGKYYGANTEVAKHCRVQPWYTRQHMWVRVLLGDGGRNSSAIVRIRGCTWHTTWYQLLNNYCRIIAQLLHYYCTTIAQIAVPPNVKEKQLKTNYLVHATKGHINYFPRSLYPT